jgi:hypothetical protein
LKQVQQLLKRSTARRVFYHIEMTSSDHAHFDRMHLVHGMHLVHVVALTPYRYDLYAVLIGGSSKQTALLLLDND